MSDQKIRELKAGDDSRVNWRVINQLSLEIQKLQRRIERLEKLNERRPIKNGGAGNGDPVWL